MSIQIYILSVKCTINTQNYSETRMWASRDRRVLNFTFCQRFSWPSLSWAFSLLKCMDAKTGNVRNALNKILCSVVCKSRKLSPSSLNTAPWRRCGCRFGHYVCAQWTGDCILTCVNLSHFKRNMYKSNKYCNWNKIFRLRIRIGCIIRFSIVCRTYELTRQVSRGANQRIKSE